MSAFIAKYPAADHSRGGFVYKLQTKSYIILRISTVLDSAGNKIKRQKTYKRISHSQSDKDLNDGIDHPKQVTFEESLDADREFFIEEYRIDLGPLLNQIHEQLTDYQGLQLRLTNTYRTPIKNWTKINQRLTI